MSIAKTLLINLLNPKTYIWMDVSLIEEAPKAILIMFDGRKQWLPKTWILWIKRNKNSNSVKIKISEYYWSKKFASVVMRQSTGEILRVSLRTK